MKTTLLTLLLSYSLQARSVMNGTLVYDDEYSSHTSSNVGILGFLIMCGVVLVIIIGNVIFSYFTDSDEEHQRKEEQERIDSLSGTPTTFKEWSKANQ